MRVDGSWRLAALLLTALTRLAGQETMASVRVFSDPPGATLTVDGSPVQSAQTFVWPQGSKHTLFASVQQTGAQFGMKYSFKYWEDSSGFIYEGGNQLIATADPKVKFIKAVFELEYLLSLAFYDCSGVEGPCASPAGSVYVDAILYRAGQKIWIPAGRTVTAQAVPNPGYVFVGWNNTADPGVNAFGTTFTMTGPRTLSPRFVPARAVEIRTEPDGLLIQADRTSIKAPARLDWGWETTHTLGVVSPQNDLYGKTWIFAGWSDGGAPVHAYTVKPGAFTETIVAKFVPGGRASFVTSPPGLKLSIDGRDNWQSYNFSWPAGETHRVSAPLEQKDAQGRTYVFKGWSDGLPAEHDITLTEADLAGFRIVAEYELMGRLSLTSQPSGLALRVNGEECKTPCVVDRPAGAAVRFAAPKQIELYDGARLSLADWVNAGDVEQSFVFTSAVKAYHADYRLMHRLMAVPDRPDGAVVRAAPESADGYYETGTEVQITAEAAAGYRFRRWEGDVTGAYRSAAVKMTAPRFARAILEAVAFVPPTGVRNAAGETPENAVAAGSVVSLFGANLAIRTEVGPQSPMAQTLAGAVVRLGARMLPLIFASPEQINLQIPYDVEPGQYKLVLQTEGQADVSIDLAVQRNAPGLFHEVIESQAFVLAARGGASVTAESPARPGDLITIWATGLGPYDRRPISGFAIPSGSVYRAADTVELWHGDAAWVVEFAGAAEGMAGIELIRFRVPRDAAAGALELKLRVNGTESNTVLLRVGTAAE